jgi:hypothetical protein
MIFKSAHGAYFSAKGYNSRILADWLADCASRAWESRLGEQGRPFGVWLLDRPDQLRRAQQDEQMAPLCFALPLNATCFFPLGALMFILRLIKCGFIESKVKGF